MRKMKRRLVIILLLLATLCACNPTALTPENGRPAVRVDLSLAVAPMEDATPGTKAIDHEPDYWSSIADAGEREAAIAASVKTVLLLQFEWTDAVAANARLIGQHFVSDWPAHKPTLNPSDKKNTILVIANVPGKLPLANGITLGSFLEDCNYSLISQLDDLSGGGVWYSPNGGTDRYLRMSGAVEKDSVGQDESISATLKLNCAKVVIKVTNTSPEDKKITIDGVKLCNINRKYYYVTNMAGFTDPFSARSPYRFEVEGTFSETTKTYTFYIPANLRGVHTSSTSAETKNDYAPQGATCFKIFGIQGTTPVHHTYYLGGDLVDDYNLAPNHRYSFEFKVKSPGDAAQDSRVDDLSEVTFSVDANCYMLQPPAAAGKSRIYAIPVRRAAVFWNQKDVYMGLYDAAGGDNEVLTLSENTPWTASVVWSDFAGDFDADTFLTVHSGTGFSNHFKVKVDSGMSGSAVVAVKNASGVILWSWHLWVTDYNPDVAMTPIPGKYLYPVPGGEIHRYNGTTLWAAGKAYEGAFMMDRNLGARASVSLYMPDTYGFLYQYGRKDPFLWDSKTTGAVSWTTPNPDGGYANTRWAVHNPTRWINRGAWQSGDWTATTDELYSTKVWHDPLFDASAGDERHEADKSIYDPCPPGWSVPQNGVLQDVMTAGKNRWDGTEGRQGRYYYPEGYDNRGTTGVIFFPAAGAYDTSSPANPLVGGCMFYRIKGECAMFNSGNFVNNNGSYTYGLRSVRCIKVKQ